MFLFNTSVHSALFYNLIQGLYSDPLLPTGDKNKTVMNSRNLSSCGKISNVIMLLCGDFITKGGGWMKPRGETLKVLDEYFSSKGTRLTFEEVTYA